MKVTNKFSKHIKSITNVISRGGKVCKGEVLQENAERRITSNDKCFRNWTTCRATANISIKSQ